jgi:farnesyl diphosphate synthase
VEQALSQWVVADAPAGLGEAMRYARARRRQAPAALLVLAACEAVAG